jgi:demethylmenaquinone methyltransferase/2-methoxy-6-polyprenyl-1,4-benzoquinol methylase
MSALPAGADKRRAVREMFDAIAPRYDLVNRVMTLRLDVGWRRRTVRALALPAGSRVADLACGTGDLCRELARQGHSPVGFDFSMGMLRAAPARVSRWPLVNADVLELPIADGALDGATCGFALRNLTAVPPLLTELARVLRPAGRIGLLEVDRPSNPILRWGHGLYFGRVVPLIGAVLSDRDAYRYLPDSVAYLPPAGELVAMARTAGFTDVQHYRLSTGIAQVITATRG